MERLHSHSRASEGDDDDFWTMVLERGEDALSICHALPADGMRKGGSTTLHSCIAQLHCTGVSLIPTSVSIIIGTLSPLYVYRSILILK